MPTLPNSFEVIHRPFLFMPVGNPVEYVFESNRQNQYLRTVGCEPYFFFSTQSYFEVRTITINLPLTLSGPEWFVKDWAFTIDGDQYFFNPCARNGGNSDANTLYVESQNVTNCAVVLGQILQAVNRNPAARGRYFAAGELTQLTECLTGTDLNEYECNPAFARISIVAQRLGRPIPIEVNPLFGTTAVVQDGVDRRFQNYRMYLLPHVETERHNSGEFVQLNDLTALAEIGPNPENAICINTDARFKFDVRRLLADYLGEDVPDLQQTQISFCRNCIRQAYVEFGDFKNEPRDEPQNNIFFEKNFEQSAAFEERYFRVLNASFDLFNSNWRRRFVNLDPLCVEVDAQDYLLKDYFEPDDVTNQRFLTNWRKKTRAWGEYDWLYWYVRSAVIDSTLEAVIQYRCADGTILEQVSPLDFQSVAPCDGNSAIREQLLMIPVHHLFPDEAPACNPVSACVWLRGVNEFTPWDECEHPGFVKQVYQFVDNPAVVYGGDLGNFTINTAGYAGPDAGYSSNNPCPTPPAEFNIWLSNRALPFNTRQFADFNAWANAVVTFHINFFQVLGGANATYANWDNGTKTLTMFYDYEHFSSQGINICATGFNMCVNRRNLESEKPEILNGPPICCTPPVNDQVTRLSEIKEYVFRQACDNERVGLMYVNQFGVNEMFWIEASIIHQTEVNRTTYERNILNIPNRQNNPPDRATAVLSADGPRTWEVDFDLSRPEDLAMLPELLHSPSVRLLLRTPILTECADPCTEDCGPPVREELVPVTIQNREQVLTATDGRQVNVTLELTEARTRNAVQVF